MECFSIQRERLDNANKNIDGCFSESVLTNKHAGQCFSLSQNSYLQKQSFPAIFPHENKRAHQFSVSHYFARFISLCGRTMACTTCM